MNAYHVNTYRDERGRLITEDKFGVKFVSDERGNAIVDADGFVTFVDVVLG